MDDIRRFMTDARRFMTDAVPGLGGEQLDVVINKLTDHGFTDIEHLIYLNPESDLKDFLNTLQCRILKDKLSKKSASQSDASAGVC
jgi:hypothetical protein